MSNTRTTTRTGQHTNSTPKRQRRRASSSSSSSSRHIETSSSKKSRRRSRSKSSSRSSTPNKTRPLKERTPSKGRVPKLKLRKIPEYSLDTKPETRTRGSTHPNVQESDAFHLATRERAFSEVVLTPKQKKTDGRETFRALVSARVKAQTKEGQTIRSLLRKLGYKIQSSSEEKTETKTEQNNKAEESAQKTFNTIQTLIQGNASLEKRSFRKNKLASHIFSISKTIALGLKLGNLNTKLNAYEKLILLRFALHAIPCLKTIKKSYSNHRSYDLITQSEGPITIIKLLLQTDEKTTDSKLIKANLDLFSKAFSKCCKNEKDTKNLKITLSHIEAHLPTNFKKRFYLAYIENILNEPEEINKISVNETILTEILALACTHAQKSFKLANPEYILIIKGLSLLYKNTSDENKKTPLILINKILENTHFLVTNYAGKKQILEFLASIEPISDTVTLSQIANIFKQLHSSVSPSDDEMKPLSFKFLNRFSLDDLKTHFWSTYGEDCWKLFALHFPFSDEVFYEDKLKIVNSIGLLTYYAACPIQKKSETSLK